MLQGLNIDAVRRQRRNYLDRRTSGGREFGAGVQRRWYVERRGGEA